ncbi:hypothetical protein [Rhodanobacter lindaniclasticus]
MHLIEQGAEFVGVQADLAAQQHQLAEVRRALLGRGQAQVGQPPGAAGTAG